MDSNRITFKAIFRIFTDFILPRRCLNCGKVNPDGEYSNFCSDCSPDIHIIRGGRCLCCSEIVADTHAPDTLHCPKCIETPPQFRQSRVIGVFDGSIRRMVIELKYNNGTYILSDLIKLIRQAPDVRKFLDGAILVPVPLHWIRKIKRGYNQSEFICRSLKKAFPEDRIKILNAVKRTKYTPTQTTLNRKSRAKNVSNVFAVKNPKELSKKFPCDTRFVVVDDVMTSGSTLSECARALRTAGFENVDAFAFARRL